MNIGIVGAGLVGRLLAWRLLKSGHKVSLFEKDKFAQPQSAANTAAAMIAHLSESVRHPEIVPNLGQRSLDLWPQWLAELEKITGQPIYFQQLGSLALAHAQDQSLLDDFHHQLSQHKMLSGQYEWQDEKALYELCADLKPGFKRGLWLKNEACVDNQALLQSLLQAIRSLKGQCYESCLAQIKCQSIITDTDIYSFDWVFDCRGVGAKVDQEEMRGVRGELVWLHCPDVNLSRPIRLLHPRYSLYIVPRPNNQYIIGATEIESEDLSPVSVQAMLELLTAAYSVNPAFLQARVIKTDVNLRPAYNDNLPKIQRKGQKVIINGLYRHGYLLAPAMIDIVLGFLVGKESTHLSTYFNWNGGEK